MAELTSSLIIISPLASSWSTPDSKIKLLTYTHVLSLPLAMSYTFRSGISLRSRGSILFTVGSRILLERSGISDKGIHTSFSKSSNDISWSSGIEPCIPKHKIEMQFAYHSARILDIEFSYDIPAPNSLWEARKNCNPVVDICGWCEEASKI